MQVRYGQKMQYVNQTYRAMVAADNAATDRKYDAEHKAAIARDHYQTAATIVASAAETIAKADDVRNMSVQIAIADIAAANVVSAYESYMHFLTKTYSAQNLAVVILAEFTKFKNYHYDQLMRCAQRLAVVALSETDTSVITSELLKLRLDYISLLDDTYAAAQQLQQFAADYMQAAE